MTVGSIGYLPAPGTMALLITLPLVWAVYTAIVAEWAYGLILVVMGVFFSTCIDRAQEAFPGESDPLCIVLEEC